MKKALKNKNVRLVIMCFFVILLVAVILFFVFGREKDKLDDTKEYNEIGLEIKPVADAVSEAKNVIGNTYQNLTLPDDFEIICGDTLYDMISYTNPDVDPRMICKDVAKIYFGDSFDESLLKERYFLEHNGLYSATYDVNPQDNASYTINTQDDGYVGINLNNEDRPVSDFDLSDPDIYIIGKDNIDGVSYSLSGNLYSIKDAIEYVTETFTSDYMSYFPGIDGIVPYGVYVFNDGNGESFYVLTFEMLYEGTPASGDGYINDVSAHAMPKYSCKFEMGAPGEIAKLLIYAPMPNEKREVEKIITLETALEHLEDTLSPNSNYKITELGLKYCRYHEGEGDPEHEVRPYWCFTVGTGGSKWGVYSPRKVIYVDAQNGDIYCYNSMSGEFEFKYIQEKQYEKEE